MEIDLLRKEITANYVPQKAPIISANVQRYFIWFLNNVV